MYIQCFCNCFNKYCVVHLLTLFGWPLFTRSINDSWSIFIVCQQPDIMNWKVLFERWSWFFWVSFPTHQMMMLWVSPADYRTAGCPPKAPVFDKLGMRHKSQHFFLQVAPLSLIRYKCTIYCDGTIFFVQPAVQNPNIQSYCYARQRKSSTSSDWREGFYLFVS